MADNLQKKNGRDFADSGLHMLRTHLDSAESSNKRLKVGKLTTASAPRL